MIENYDLCSKFCKCKVNYNLCCRFSDDHFFLLDSIYWSDHKAFFGGLDMCIINPKNQVDRTSIFISMNCIC